jgi:hypothetical protein
MEEFDIKRGDTGPSIRYSLLPATITIAGATVRFQMRAIGSGQTLIDAVATIITPSPPVVQYDWQAGDTDTAGIYQAEWRVEYADSSVETFPNRGFVQVNVNDDIPSLP